jgi:hypothetical protein
VQAELGLFSKEFMQQVSSVRRKGGQSVLIIKETLQKKNISLLDEALMLYIYFSINVTIVPEKKMYEALLSYHLS